MQDEVTALRTLVELDQARRAEEAAHQTRWIGQLPVCLLPDGFDATGRFYIRSKSTHVTGKHEDYNVEVVRRLPASSKEFNELKVRVEGNQASVSTHDRWISRLDFEVVSAEFGFIKAAVFGLPSNTKPGTRKSTVHATKLVLDALGIK